MNGKAHHGASKSQPVCNSDNQKSLRLDWCIRLLGPGVLYTSMSVLAEPLLWVLRVFFFFFHIFLSFKRTSYLSSGWFWHFLWFSFPPSLFCFDFYILSGYDILFSYTGCAARHMIYLTHRHLFQLLWLWWLWVLRYREKKRAVIWTGIVYGIGCGETWFLFYQPLVVALGVIWFPCSSVWPSLNIRLFCRVLIGSLDGVCGWWS